MMKTLQQSIQVGALCLIAILLCTSLAAQTSLRGNVSDEENGEPILLGNVALFKNGIFITSVETDFDGNYQITNIDAGIYDVEINYLGYHVMKIVNVVVKEGKLNRSDIQLYESVCLYGVIVYNYSVPLIEEDNTTQGNVFVADPMRNTLIKP